MLHRHSLVNSAAAQQALDGGDDGRVSPHPLPLDRYSLSLDSLYSLLLRVIHLLFQQPWMTM